MPNNGTPSGSGIKITNINPGMSKYITITGKAIDIGTFTNTVKVTSTSDSASENNTYSVDVTVRPLEDLGITKTANPTSMLLGASVDFVVTITNHGLMDADWERLEVTDQEAIEVKAYKDEDSSNNTASAIITVDAETPTIPEIEHHHSSSTTPVPEVIVEPEVPLAETPVATPEAVVVAPVIPEEPVPLAYVVPQTSDAGNIWLLLALMLGSGAGIATLGRRKETAEK